MSDYNDGFNAGKNIATWNGRDKIQALTAEVERLTAKNGALEQQYKDDTDTIKEQVADNKRLKAALKARDGILKTCYDDVGVGGYIIEQIEALKKSEVK